MSERYSERLMAFFKHWDDRVKRGQNSSIGGIEAMMLEIYDNWLRDYEKPECFHLFNAPLSPNSRCEKCGKPIDQVFTHIFNAP